ncbi:S-adenosyl-L-methionine-dependent methyltransferase [Scenedesmus sp. NREL 46B-D3]|nr:S-adenosyl-L-methionine-dependent methyltransferase [Scenedesmus sp. NREL 46B-D3]
MLSRLRTASYTGHVLAAPPCRFSRAPRVSHRKGRCRTNSNREGTDADATAPQQQQQQQQQQLQQLVEPELDASKRRQLEDELRDPNNFLEYLLPRPLRLAFFGFSAASTFVAALISAAKLIQEPALQAAEGGGAQNLVINLVGLLVFAGLFYADQAAGEARVEQRRQLRQAQIRSGDREVLLDEQGQKVSRLREVDDDWIARRLERWGKRDGMPFLGPSKAAIVQQLVQQRQPRLAVEVGTMAGYSAIKIAQVLPPGGRLVSIEKDVSWLLVAKRFLWQASQGQNNKQRQTPLGSMVDVWWGDACSKLPEVAAKFGRPIDFLLLDGTPKETLAYLQAAEPHLAPGAVVLADNAGVFAEGGMKPYLQYVRSSSSYSSRYIAAPLEWQDNVKDGMEVSTKL